MEVEYRMRWGLTGLPELYQLRMPFVNIQSQITGAKFRGQKEKSPDRLPRSQMELWKTMQTTRMLAQKQPFTKECVIAFTGRVKLRGKLPGLSYQPKLRICNWLTSGRGYSIVG